MNCILFLLFIALLVSPGDWTIPLVAINAMSNQECNLSPRRKIGAPRRQLSYIEEK